MQQNVLDALGDAVGDVQKWFVDASEVANRSLSLNVGH